MRHTDCLRVALPCYKWCFYVWGYTLPLCNGNLLWVLCLCRNRRTKTPRADSRSTHIGLSCGILYNISVKTPVNCLHREKKIHILTAGDLKSCLERHKCCSDRHKCWALMWLQFTLWWLKSNQTVDDIIRVVWGENRGGKVSDVTHVNVVNALVSMLH